MCSHHNLARLCDRDRYVLFNKLFVLPSKHSVVKAWFSKNLFHVHCRSLTLPFMVIYQLSHQLRVENLSVWLSFQPMICKEYNTIYKLFLLLQTSRFPVWFSEVQEKSTAPASNKSDVQQGPPGCNAQMTSCSTMFYILQILPTEWPLSHHHPLVHCGFLANKLLQGLKSTPYKQACSLCMSILLSGKWVKWKPQLRHNGVVLGAGQW